MKPRATKGLRGLALGMEFANLSNHLKSYFSDFFTAGELGA